MLLGVTSGSRDLSLTRGAGLPPPDARRKLCLLLLEHWYRTYRRGPNAWVARRAARTGRVDTPRHGPPADGRTSAAPSEAVRAHPRERERWGFRVVPEDSRGDKRWLIGDRGQHRRRSQRARSLRVAKQARKR